MKINFTEQAFYFFTKAYNIQRVEELLKAIEKFLTPFDFELHTTLRQVGLVKERYCEHVYVFYKNHTEYLYLLPRKGFPLMYFKQVGVYRYEFSVHITNDYTTQEGVVSNIGDAE